MNYLLTRLTLATLCALAGLNPAAAQLDPTWIVADPGIAANSIAADPLGGVVAVGTTFSPADAWVRSYDGNGSLRWSSTFDAGLGLEDSLRLVAVAPNGDVVAVGQRVGYVGTMFVYDVFLRRYDRLGNLLWATSYDGPFGNRIDKPWALRIAADGSIVVAGESSGPAGDQDLTVWRFDAGGNLVWVAYANGVYGLTDYAAGVAIDAFGNVVACGASTWIPGSNGDVFVASFSPAGALQWTREFAGPLPGHERGNSIVADAAGRVFVAASLSTSTGYQATLMAFDAAGNVVWSRASAAGAADGRQVVLTDAGAVVLLGQSQDAAVISGITVDSYDTSGALLWWHQRPRALPREILARAGGVVDVCGGAYEATTTIGSAYLARYGSDGTEHWARVYGTPAAGEMFHNLAPAPADGLYVGGWPTTLYLSRWDASGGTLCYGDELSTPCPCGNSSVTGERAGCANSLGPGGALRMQGTASLSSDTLTLVGTGMPDASALYFQGTKLVNGGMGAAFGDGLRCVAGTVVRLATRTNVGGGSAYPGMGDAPVHVRGLVAGPGVRSYQIWYRNPAAFCTSATFNLTNALRIEWAL